MSSLQPPTNLPPSEKQKKTAAARRARQKQRKKNRPTKVFGDQAISVPVGILTGLGMAAIFSLIATVPIAIGAARSKPIGLLLWVYPFYFVAGALGGAIVGLLAPIQHRFLGRMLTAYLVVLLVYGGGTIALWPLLREADDPNLPPTGLVGVWAAISLPLAFVYERMFRSTKT